MSAADDHRPGADVSRSFCVRARHGARAAFAVAQATFVEAVRNKILFGILIFAGVLLAATPFLPSIDNPDSRARLVILYAQIGVAFISMITAIVIGAPAVGREMESRLIYSILTKPVGRSSYLFGKTLGVGAVALFVLLFAFLFELLFFQTTLPSEMLVAREAAAPARIELLRGDVPARDVTDDMRRGEAVPLLGTTPFRLRYHFENVDGPEFDTPDTRLLLNFIVGSGRWVRHGEVGVRIGGSERKEKIASRTVQEIAFDASPGSAGASLTVDIERVSFDYALVAGGDSLLLLKKPQSFFLNTLKAAALRGMAVILMSAIAVFGSSFMTTPVSMFFSVFMYFFGVIAAFLQEILITSRGLLAGRDIAAQAGLLDRAAKWALEIVSRYLAPNFSRFDVDEQFLVERMNIPITYLYDQSLYCVAYLAVLFVLTLFFFAFREVRE